MGNKVVENRYFKWLIEQIGVKRNSFLAYETLLRQLYMIEFRPKLAKDENRVLDGLELRKVFEVENGSGYLAPYDLPCSTLEVLVALAKRISEDVLGDPDNENLKRIWFWKWLENLGVLEFYGKNYDRGIVCILVEIWMNRDFEPNGKGSPFPLNNPPCDQRTAEIWKQVMLYLAENEVEDEV